MSVQKIDDAKLFLLSTRNTSYVFHIDKNGRPVHLHYGGRVKGTEGLLSLDWRKGHSSFSPAPEGEEYLDSPDALPLEFSGFNSGDYRIGSATIQRENGSCITDALYVSHRILNGKPALAGLPSSFGASDVLEMTLRDPAGTEFVLIYSVFEECDIIARSVLVKNGSGSPIRVKRLMSFQMDFRHANFDLIQLSGSWSRERHAERTALHSGLQTLRSGRGASGHQNSPAVALASRDAGEESGDVYGAVLAYSGNFALETECDQYGTTRLCAGLNSDLFTWTLAAGESFQAPEGYLTFSANGLGGMSRNYHDFMRNHLISPKWAKQKRPLLVNSWEAAYFDFNTEKLLRIAESAARLGIEMLVLDDGWFGTRNDDRSSLGDWFVNREKIGDLGGLSQRIHALGLKFGLWFEPEMVSLESELYRKHPEWVLQEPNRRRSIGRSQLLLDFSRPEVVDYLFGVIAETLRSAQIEYVKWDMNRNLTEVYSAVLPADRQMETAHRYQLGVYRLHEMLLKEFPDLLIEGCSGGGGRFDAGMLAYVPQIWCSDDTDAMERIPIQLGTSCFYPVSASGAHVSVCPNHITGRVTPFETRGNIALSGTFGYELDLSALSAAEQELVRGQVADYHRYHDIIANGDLYRLTGVFHSDDRFHAWMYVSKDKKRALITVVCRTYQPNGNIPFVRPRGLNPDFEYELDGRRISGMTLMSAGFPAVLKTGDGASRIYLLESK